MTGSVLTLNAGSSSVKFALFEADAGLAAVARGAIEGLHDAPRFFARDASGAAIAERRWAPGVTLRFDEALRGILDFAESHLGSDGLVAVGHRVVHGGAAHRAPEPVTPALVASLEALTPLDPLHMPDNLAPIRAMASARPRLPQVVCFDTAFHHTLPPVARRFALPRAISDAGVRRYGFHGLSYEYIAGRLAEVAPALARGRVIVAHLGSGASLCALKAGASIATTTGFSALDGLMMATRCGGIDPGVLLHLGRIGYAPAAIEDMLYRHSGLLGVSGISGDVRVLLASEDPHAREALDLFVYRIACEVGALISALGGLDGLVFTAGIGENAAPIRAAVCERLAWIGARINPEANQANATRIDAADSAIALSVIPTDEEAMIARHVQAALAAMTQGRLKS